MKKDAQNIKDGYTGGRRRNPADPFHRTTFGGAVAGEGGTDNLRLFTEFSVDVDVQEPVKKKEILRITFVSLRERRILAYGREIPGGRS